MEDVVLMGDPRVTAIRVRECGDILVDLHAVPDLALMSLDANPQLSQLIAFCANN